MKNIGICSTWFNRGAGYIATQIRDAFKWHRQDVKIHIFARQSVADGKSRFGFSNEFYHNSIQYYPSYVINSEDFKRWVRIFKLDAVVFVEELFTKNLIDVCKRDKIPAFNYIVWENVNPAELDYYKQFEGLICPTKCSFEYLKKAGVGNAHHIKWGVDLNIFKYFPLIPFNKRKIKFFFQNGWGGVHNRKNQESILQAFSQVTPRNKTVLDIHSQKKEGLEENFSNTVGKSIGDIDRNALTKRLVAADISLIPSRWEGNGLPYMESLAIGRPVITVNAPPMNERMINGTTGYLVKVKEFKYLPNIFVQSAEIDVDDFVDRMIQLSEDLDLLQYMSIKSRQYAEQELDWFVNSKELIQLIGG